MRILTISDSAWDDGNSIGNTYSNLFSDWKECEFYNIFFREAAPRNSVCTHYFRITDKMLLKNLLTPSRIGQEFIGGDAPKVQSSEKNEKALISLIHRYNINFVYTLERMLWKLKGWQNEKLNCFIKSADPNIVFSFAVPSVHFYLVLKYLKQHTDAKIVLFIVDNVYGDYLSGKRNPKENRAIRFQEMMKMADKVYAISEEMQRVYGKEFSIDIDLLYKGCTFETPAKETVEDPVKIVYAGNLLFGRMEILMKLAQSIQRVNQKLRRSYFLEVYSGTVISDEEMSKLSIPGASQFCGSRPYEQIKTILSQADLVLHVESFEESQIKNTCYSFSTKIIDCLQCGSVLFVIGPKGITSVEYPRKIQGTIVVDDLEQLERVLTEFPIESLPERAKQIREFAIKNHQIDVVHSFLKGEFKELIGVKQ